MIPNRNTKPVHNVKTHRYNWATEKALCDKVTRHFAKDGEQLTCDKCQRLEAVNRG